MSNLNFSYVPLTFISNREEIKKQIRNTLILIHLFEKYNAPIRLENLIKGTQYGYNASALQSGKNKFLRISDIHESKVNWESVPYCNCNDEETYLLKNDDILIARTGGTTGKSFKIDNPPANSIYAGYLIRIRARQEVNPDYLYLFLHSFAYWSQIVNLNDRHFRPKANAENLKSLILPDCPRDIQNDAVTISNGESVKGYEELYSEIEKAIAEYDKTQEVQKLFSDQLTQLENLNQAILQEAVQGKLVKQDKKDEPASELLNRIRAEKVKSGRKERPLPPIKTEEIPFDIPQNWVWCRLGDAVNLKRGKSKHRPRNDRRLFSNGVYPFIQTGDVSKAKNNNDLITTINGYYNDLGLSQSEMQPKGSLCITIAANIAECGFLDFDACVPDSIVCLIAIDKCIENFVYQYLKLAKADLERFAPATAQKNINLGILNDLIIPLPPLSEQKRVVAEIEKQLAKTKQLKEHIIANQQATEQLLKALLHQAFELKENKAKKVQQTKGKVVELAGSNLNWDTLVAEPFGKHAAHPVNNVRDIDWEMAMMVACMKNKLGVTYGDVGLQKNVYNTNHLQPVFSKQYAFANSNFGTYCYELKDDLKRNPYLIAQKVANNKEVYAVNPKYRKQVLDKLSAPENKDFVQTMNRMLSIYEHPFINKETDKIELYNTVLKVAFDKNTRDIDSIYQGMKDWNINQNKYKTKAEKFTKLDAERMLKLLMDKTIL